jgi:thioredoxin reductase
MTGGNVSAQPLEWLIVGGGLHGVHLAARLIGEAGAARDSLRIVDPGARLLARWRTRTATTGMTHLRSPSVHHLDLNPWSLQRFAGRRKHRRRRLFVPPYDRPALGLFNAHCDQVIETFGLDGIHIRDRVVSCAVGCGGVGVQLSSGLELEARNLVLALGASEQPEWPDWAPPSTKRVRHIFEPGFDGWPASPETVVVVGGGISAAQTALRLIDEGHGVHLVSRHDLREHQFDSDPGWLGPKFMANFSRERDAGRRRALIVQARHKGSVPPDVRRALGEAIARGRLAWHAAEVERVDVRGDGVGLKLSDRSFLEAGRVLLATGFSVQRPGGAMVDALISSAALPCASCGYPIVDSALRWHPRVYVSGPLAELELGPASRNIAGARRAGDRLVSAARAERGGKAGMANR